MKICRWFSQKHHEFIKTNINKKKNKMHFQVQFKDFRVDFKFHSPFLPKRYDLKIHQKMQEGLSYVSQQSLQIKFSDQIPNSSMYL